LARGELKCIASSEDKTRGLFSDYLLDIHKKAILPRRNMPPSPRQISGKRMKNAMVMTS
jgi:hypothetical protein